MFPKVNYSNSKEFLSTHGYDAPPLLLLMIRDAPRDMLNWLRSTDKQICGIKQNICCSPSFIPRQNNVHDNTSNQLRSEAMRATAWAEENQLTILSVIVLSSRNQQLSFSRITPNRIK
uniref:Uncharacterized protein n=1 Tax=Octopus bimaculoides TaxID=37653 RepID=A0A0L8HJ33_OCTBM